MALPTPTAPAGGSEPLVLDEAAAALIWNWILARQGLTDSRRLSTAWQVADAALGLHAARLPSPYAMVAARTSHPAIPASLFTAPARATLMTVRCMRKTLHVLPLPLAAAAHVATLRFRDRDARRAVINAGYTTAAIEQVTEQLCALLQDGPLAHRAIEARLATHGTGIQATRLAIKLARERGMIVYINAATTWNREVRTFALTSAAYPDLDASLPREQAVTELVTAYFDRYGPATLRDATWWSGLPATDITTALRACGRPVITVATPWSRDPCLMFADQAAESTASNAATGVQFLAHEDSALKAYFQTRGRYLGGLPQQRAFNQIGEAMPCILVDGLVAGTWSWNARTATVDIDLIPGRYPAPTRRQVSARAAALAQTLRSKWARPSSPRELPRSGTAVGARAVNSTAPVRHAASVTTSASPAPPTR